MDCVRKHGVFMGVVLKHYECITGVVLIVSVIGKTTTFDLIKKKYRAAIEERKGGSGRKNSDLITMIGAVARVCVRVCVVCKIIFKKHQVCLLSSRKPTRGHCCAQIEDVAIQFIFAEIDLGVFQTTCERYCNKMAEMCLPSLTCGGPLYSHQRSGQFSLRWLICLEESRRN